MTTINKFSLSILFIFIFQYSYSQCCSAGSPFFYGESSIIEKGGIQLITGYKYSKSDNYFSGDSKVDIEYIDKSYFNFQTFQILYGITERLSAQADIGYYYNRTEVYKNQDWDNSIGHGISDMNVKISYLAYSNWKHQYKILPSLGAVLPVGVFDQEVDNVKLPITVQPSSGSYKYNASILFTKAFKNHKLNLNAFALFEYSQLIDSKNFYYKYGNRYLLSTMLSYSVLAKLSVAVELRGDFKAKAKREENQIVESSGYGILFANPHLSWSINKKLTFATNLELPVYKYYNGIQLANSFSYSARISYKF